MEEIKNRKREIRKQMRQIAVSLEREQMEAMAKSVFERVEKSSLFQQAKTVAFYWSMGDELPTHKYVEQWSKSKRIVLPVIEGGPMFFRAYNPDVEMNKAKLDYLEPAGREMVGPDEIDLMLLPGVAFDKDGGRLGRGMGYYDRYLSDYKGATIGVCMTHQVIDKVPTDDHDQPLHALIYPCAPIE